MKISTEDLKKEQSRVIYTISFGSILEWFELYSYGYLVPVIAAVFFRFDSHLLNIFSAFLVFGAGFIARPFGAILFGRWGDTIGRKKTFMRSIIFMTIPSFAMGLLPTYAMIGIWAPILLTMLRILQSIPLSGEASGAGCFLYENADITNKRFMTSWMGVGNQIGAMVGFTEAFIMDQLISHDFLLSWGWRIFFCSSGLIGLLGIFLRSSLHETPVFKELQKRRGLDESTVWELLGNYKKKIILGTAFGAINAATFYLVAIYMPVYFETVLKLGPYTNAILFLSTLIIITVLIPFFGFLGDKVNNRFLLISSSLLTIFSLIWLYFSINYVYPISISIAGVIYLMALTCITALLPYRLTHLFPTKVRYTGVGLTFNLADGIVGGLTASGSILLVQLTHKQGAFCWFVMLFAIISLIAYFKVKD